MATFAKPENALKRAEELLNVGQKQAALQALHALITSKRYRTWQKTLEKIMFKYIELCVDMRKGRYAKDGLIQYRISCQQVNVSSLEEVVKHFIKLSTERAEAAQAAAEGGSAEANLGEVADLDAEKSPEDLMLSFVSGEKSKERADRETVTPWFKFLWETYRTVLDILRNNSKLESLYAMTAHRAFSFCLQYKRTNEFRRLCEILRNHLINLHKYRDQRDRPDLSQPESLQLYLDTRFEQLKVATELELWQEAFRSVEDIHGLMLLAKKPPKAQLMAVYYAKLTKIFWMAAIGGTAAGSGGVGGSLGCTPTNRSSLLYHAHAWVKLYALQRAYNKNLKDKDLQLLASAVVLAALAVPPYADGAGRGGRGPPGLAPAGGAGRGPAGFGGADAELERERCLRMANLIGIVVDAKSDPRDLLSRSALLHDISAKGVLNYALPQVKELYALVEGSASGDSSLAASLAALDLGKRVQPLLAMLPELSAAHKLSAASPVPKVELEQYAPALQKLATLRTLHQASQVYDVMRMANLWALVPFGPPVYAESVLVEAVVHGFVQARLDFREGVVKFGAEDLETDKMRTHLVTMAQNLSRAVSRIVATTDQQPDAAADAAAATALQQQHRKRDAGAVSELQAAVAKEHQRLLMRKVLIERRKEEAEREVLEKEREEQTAKLRQQKLTEEAEKKRLAAESARREEERIRREIEAKELEEARQLLIEAEKRKGKKGKKVDEANLKGLDKRQLMEEAMSEQLKERAEAEKRLAKLAKTLDYVERARREEERPLLEQQYAEFLVEQERWWQEQQAEKLAKSQAEHAAAVEEKQRLSRMLEEKELFQVQVVSRRRDEFERLQREREERLAELRELRHTERVALRKREAYRRREEARALAAMEEEERRKKEEMERKKREEEERQRKLDEIAARQRQREQEAEEKARREREEILKGGGGGGDGGRPKATFLPPALRAREGSAAAGEAPPSAGGADRWRPNRGSESRSDAGERAEGLPRDRSAAATNDRPGRFVPSKLRGGTDAGGEEDKDVYREREDAVRSTTGRYAPPVRPSAGGGGAYEPSKRDTGAVDKWSASRGSEPPPRATSTAAPAAAVAPAASSSAPAAAAPAKGKFVPPHLRNRS